MRPEEPPEGSFGRRVDGFTIRVGDYCRTRVGFILFLPKNTIYTLVSICTRGSFLQVYFEPEHLTSTLSLQETWHYAAQSR